VTPAVPITCWFIFCDAPVANIEIVNFDFVTVGTFYTGHVNVKLNYTEYIGYRATFI
jgi:hypothetical protein